MKKFFLLLVAAVIGSTGVFAQSSLLATLSHEGEISTFYGASAFVEANTAAVSGDIITLSSGTFTSADITKAITLRGAGMGIDTTALQKDATVLAGEFKISMADEETKRLTIEGIYTNNPVKYDKVNNATFLKCRFSYFTSYSATSSLKDASFIHCRMAERFSLSKVSSALCVSSVLGDAYTYGGNTSNFEFVNCIIRDPAVQYSSFKNCIILKSSGTSSGLPSNCTAYNCIGSGATNIFNNMTNATNTYVDKPEDIFTTYNSYSTAFEKLDTERFLLTEEAQTKYLGGDKTQVGIYGGSLPYSPNPTNPQIVKCNVAPQSTADGKLSVDLQIAVAE